jgi:hypothetical protein|tara:strand:- start:506 stop:886 length:381 start_codon:yes stop_codon:yes gene_type:complete
MQVSKHIKKICKIILVVVYYVLVLIFIGPVIDHAFSRIKTSDTNFEIFTEVLLQLLTVTIVWFYLSKLMFTIGHRVFNLHSLVGIDDIIEIVSGIMLVGLQKNLLEKLSYITKVHPFRFIQFIDKI